jgi:hypothetical protein
MPRSQRLSSAIPPIAFERPACPKCKAAMMLASIEPARPGVGNAVMVTLGEMKNSEKFRFVAEGGELPV